MSGASGGTSGSGAPGRVRITVLNTFTITGTITEAGAPLEDVTVTATGGHEQTVTTNADGEFTFTGVTYGATDITITPSFEDYIFTPTTRTIDGPVTANVTDQDFTASPPVFVDHIRITHSGSALTCTPTEPITIRACANAGCDEEFTDSVTTTLQPTGWVGGDTITFSGGSTTRQLRRTTPGTVTLGTTGTSPTPSGPARCFIGATETCQLTFHDAGFIFNNGAGVPDHISADPQTVTIAAVRTDDATQNCAPAFGEPRTINFWSSYENPGSGTLPVTINGDPIATASPGTAISIPFDTNAEADITLRYADVGQLMLEARFEGTGDEAGMVMVGSSDFVVRPSHFLLGIPGNPEAADADGAVFIKAGEDFTVNVSARNADDEITPNFGQESPAESVDLAPVLVSPAGGENPPLTGSFGDFGEDCEGDPATLGTACGNFAWPEVGIIQLAAELTSGAYLGTVNVTDIAADRVNVGRFVPHHFTVTQNTPGFAAACGEFTYIGQKFEYETEPVVTVTARAAAGGITQNYTGDFFKLTNDKLDEDGDRTYESEEELDLEMIHPDLFTDPIIEDLGLDDAARRGEATLTFSVGEADNDGGITFVREEPVAPFEAGIYLTFNLIDEDEVVLGNTDGDDLNPVRIPDEADTHIEFDSESWQRWGRLRMINASGSELLPLSVPLVLEYADDTTSADLVSFAVNTDDDNCVDLALSDFDFDGPLEGTSTPSLVPIENGTGAIDFSAPDVTGYIEAEARLDDNGLSFLQYNWDSSDPPAYSGGQEKNPHARASFGIFRGPRSIIYIREPW